MMKLAILMFFVAAAAAGPIQPAVELVPTDAENDMEVAATHHLGYERNIGLYAGALPAVYPGGFGGGFGGYPSSYYPSAYPSYPSYSPGYGGAYGYPYRPYPSYGVGVFAG
ncbi:uncharacterized protein LOC124202161 [Daphnia pulex]|uniref:uncharacterized protein LOC124202161 n=1 Tax=Daphnia pulex TaxID=6669 RepID=UPI001EE001C3|nr:uncharacterized protein LOC124202161 [Daphnia pulex]